MRDLTQLSLSRPVGTIIVLAAALLFGFYAFLNMRIELMPDVDSPIIAVRTSLPGASPEVVDKDVTDVLEEQINTIQGIDFIQSQSFEGQSLILVNFKLERSIDSAASDVRAKVNLAKADLPDDVEETTVDKFSPWIEPFMILSLDVGDSYLKSLNYADKVVRRKLQTVQGVGSVNLVGGPDREIQIRVDVDQLNARGLNTKHILDAIRNNHKEVPGGRLTTTEKEFNLKLRGEYTEVAQLEKLVISKTEVGLVQLSDVAEVVDDFEERRTIARLNSRPIIGLQLQKQRGANEVEASKRVRALITELNESREFKVHVVHDSSSYVLSSMNGVRKDLILGVLLTSLLMWLFLKSPRSTFVAVLSIPVSLISSFAVLFVLGISVNNLSMLAISLAIGLVIDNTIVTIENIFRYQSMGHEPLDAAKKGTKEVFFSVLAGTATTVSVFLPVAFMSNMIGRYLYAYGMAIVVSVTISFFVSITLTPFFASRFMKDGEEPPKSGAFFLMIQKIYTALLKKAIHYRISTIAIVTAIFFFSLFLGSTIGVNFVPDEDNSRFRVEYELPLGSTLEKSSKVARSIEQIFAQDKEVDYSYTIIGADASREVNKGVVHVYLHPKAQRRPITEIVQSTREKIAANPVFHGVRYAVLVRPMKSISLAIQGTDYEQLVAGTIALRQELNRENFLNDLEISLKPDKPVLDVQINRDLAQELKVPISKVGSEIYNLVQGVEVARFKEDGYRYKILLRALQDFRNNPEDIGRIKLLNEEGSLVPLPVLANVVPGTGVNRVDRYNRVWSVTLNANARGLSTAEATERLEQIFKEKISLKYGLKTIKTGDSKGMEESFLAMLTAFLFSVVIVYMVMAIQFESFWHPLVVMGALPLSIIGVLGLLFLIQMPINILIFMGMILLVGIVVNNAIILVDFINQERARGTPRDEAIIKSAPLRLRPIVMTALSTIISVVPVSLGLSEGAELRQPMSIAIIGGMLTSSPLTLLVIPVTYSLVDDLLSSVSKILDKLKFWCTKSTPEKLPGETLSII